MSAFSTLASIGLAYFLLMQAGWFLLLILRVKHTELSALETVCLAFGLGVGAMTWQMEVWALLTFPLTLNYIVGFWVGAWGLYALVVWRAAGWRGVFPTWQFKRPTWEPLTFIPAALIVATVALVFFRATYHPIWEWDGWAIWDLKARAFFATHTIHSFVEDPYYGLTHRDYPLLYSLAGTLMHLTLGRATDFVLLLPATFYAATLGLFYTSLRRYQSSAALAAWLTLGLAWMPNILFWGQQFYADVPLLFFALSSLAFTFLYGLNPSWNHLVIAGALAGFATQTKAEGIFFVVPPLVALGWQAWRAPSNEQRQSFRRALGVFAALVGSIAFPWALYRWLVPTAATLSVEKAQVVWTHLSELPHVVQVLLSWMVNPQFQGLFVWMFPATLLLLALNGRAYWRQWPLNYVLGYSLFILVPYLIFFVTEPVWLENVRLGRYLITFTGAWYFLLAVQAVGAWRTTATPSRARWQQLIVLGLAASIALGDVGLDMLGRVERTIFTSRPAQLVLDVRQSYATLAALSPTQRRHTLEINSGHPAYTRLIQVALEATPPTENIGFWLPPDHPDGGIGYLFQRSTSLLYPRKIYILSDPTQLTAEALRTSNIGTLITYDRELPPDSIAGLTLYQIELRFSIVRLTLTTASAQSAPQFINAPVQFAEGLHLLGYEWVLTLPDAESLLVLNWQNAQPLTTSYTVFVHVFDAAGGVIATHDGLPAWGQAPTQFWQPLSVVIDAHPLALPIDQRAGAKFCIGFYNSANGERLPITTAEGYETANNTACRPLPSTVP